MGCTTVVLVSLRVFRLSAFVKHTHGKHTRGCMRAGLVKVMLAGEARLLPGNLHFSAPNPASAGLASGALRVVAANTAWPGGVAAISSFGFGGSNAHVLLRCGAPSGSACQAVHSAPHPGDACSGGATEVADLDLGVASGSAEPARAPGAGGAAGVAEAGSAADHARQLPLASRTREGLERLAAAVRRAGTQLMSSHFCFLLQSMVEAVCCWHVS